MSSKLWLGIGAVILLTVSGFGVHHAAEATDKRGWREHVCTVVSSDAVDVGDEQRRAAVEGQLRRADRPQLPVSEPLRLATFDERAVAEAAAQDTYSEGASFKCWIDPSGDGIAAAPTKARHVVAAWVFLVVALGHLLLLVALWRRDRMLATTQIAPEHAPDWLPKTLLKPPDGFSFTREAVERQRTPYRRPPPGADAVLVRYQAHGNGHTVVLLLMMALATGCFGIPMLVAGLVESAPRSVGAIILVGWWALTLRSLHGVVALGVEIRFDDERLRGTVRKGRRPTHFAVSRKAIHGVVHQSDKPESDSFRTWGLMLEAQSVIELLTRQPRDKGQWLGQVIGAWANRRLQVREPDNVDA